jgi:hypothetical protein
VSVYGDFLLSVDTRGGHLTKAEAAKRLMPPIQAPASTTAGARPAGSGIAGRVQPRYSPGTVDVPPHSMLQYATPDWITSTLSIRPPQPGQSATTLRSPPARATLRGSLATSSELDL